MQNYDIEGDDVCAASIDDLCTASNDDLCEMIKNVGDESCLVGVLGVVL